MHVCVCTCVCVCFSLTADLGNKEARLGTRDFSRYGGLAIGVSY